MTFTHLFVEFVWIIKYFEKKFWIELNNWWKKSEEIESLSNKTHLGEEETIDAKEKYFRAHNCGYCNGDD